MIMAAIELLGMFSESGRAASGSCGMIDGMRKSAGGNFLKRKGSIKVSIRGAASQVGLSICNDSSSVNDVFSHRHFLKKQIER